MVSKRERIAVAFTKAILAEYWPDCQDIDGASVQEIGLATGVMVRVPYDPKKHGHDEYGTEPGDDWYVMNPSFPRTKRRKPKL